MEITETLIKLIQPLLDKVGVPVHNLGTAALDVVLVVGIAKRQMSKWFPVQGWMVWAVGLLISAISALQFIDMGFAAVLVGGLGTFLLSVVQLAASGRLGHWSPTNKFGANPSKT
jgi:hypothetical protein